MKKTSIFCLFIYLALIAVSHSSVDEQDEIRLITQMLQSDSANERLSATEYAYRLKIHNDEIYNLVYKLLSVKPFDQNGAGNDEELTNMIGILSSSKQSEHKQLIKKIALTAKDSELRDYALNEIETSNGTPKANRGDTVSQNSSHTIKMIKSENLFEVRDAAIAITHGTVQDEAIYDIVESTLLKMMVNFQPDITYVDTMAWLCKALGSSGNEKYIDSLNLVRSKTPNNKVAEHALLAVDHLSPPIASEYAFTDPTNGLEWYVVPGDKSYSFNEGVKTCLEIGERANKDMCIPSMNEYMDLWEKYKNSDVINIFKEENYLSRDIEEDGTAFLPLIFSFATGNYSNAYASRLTCVSVKCPNIVRWQK